MTVSAAFVKKAPRVEDPRNYMEDVSNKVKMLENVVLNLTTKFREETHVKLIDQFTEVLINIVNDTSFETILLSTSNLNQSRKSSPGWKAFVGLFQDTAKFCH